MNIPALEITALLPCKPDHASRQVPLAGPLGEQAAQLRMMGCEAQGATFAVSAMAPGPGTQAPEAMALWRKATLNNLAAHDIKEAPIAAAGLTGSSGSIGLAQPSLVTAQGKHPNGGAVTLQALWWVQGHEVVHAVIYAERISTEMSDSFFTGLKVKSL